MARGSHNFTPGQPAPANLTFPETTARIEQGGTVDNWGTTSGKWTTATNWSNGVPTATSAVVLSSAAPEIVTYGSIFTVYSLISSTDTLNMATGTLTITNGATFGSVLTMANTSLVLDASGSMSGGVTLGTQSTISLASGVTNTVSNALMISGGTAALTGPGTLLTTGATGISDNGPTFFLGQGADWTNTGTVTDAGQIDFGIPIGKTADTSALSIVNSAGGVFNLTTADADLLLTTPPAPAVASFTNAGLLEDTNTAGTNDLQSAVVNTGSIVLAAGGILEIDGALTNTGTVSIGASTLELFGGGALGAFTAASGALDLAGGSFTDSVAALSQVATLQIGGALALTTSGTLTSAVTLQPTGALTLNHGVATSIAGLIINGGAIEGPGTLTTTGTTTIAALSPGLSIGSGLNWINNGTVNDAGLVDLGITANGSADLSTLTLTNSVAATFDITTPAGGLALANTGAGFTTNISNAGLLEDTATSGLVTVQANITNAGTISVAAGTLAITGAITNAGLLDVNAATLQLDGGGAVGTLIAASGTLDLAGGSFTGGNIALSEVANLQIGGTLSLTGNAGTLTNNVSLVQGTVNLTAGTRTIIANGLIDSGGTFSGAGSLLTYGASVLNYGYGGLFLGNGATWTNSGTVTAADYVNLGLFNGGSYDSSTVTLINTAGAVYNITGNQGIQRFYATASFHAAFNNAGLLEKTGGVGTSNINIAITNTGTIGVTAGTLELSGGGTIGGLTTGTGTLDLGSTTFSAGITNVTGVATLEIGGGTLDLNAGAGTFTNTVALAAGGTLMLASGAAGTTSFAGTVLANGGTIAGAATFATLGTVSLLSGGAGIDIGDGATWNNAGAILAANTATFGGTFGGNPDSSTVTLTNLATGTYDFINDVGIGLAATGPGFNAGFNNAGLLEKTAGTATSNIAVFLTNTGSITASSGILQLGGGGLLGGTIGATGTAGVVLLSGNGSFTASGLTIADNGTNIALTIGSGSTLTNTGTTTLDGAVLIGSSGTGATAALLNAAGAVLVLGSADAAVSNSGSYVFNNAGIIRDTFAGALVMAERSANVGTIDVAAGTLQLSNVTGSGGLLIEAGATLEIVANVYTTQAYAFNGLGATLKQDTPTSIKSAIGGLAAGARIDLAGAIVSSATTKGNTLTVVANTGTYTYVGASPVAGYNTGIVSDGNGGSIVTLVREATAGISAQPLSFGNVHVGATGTASLSVTNTDANDGYSEALDAQVGSLSAGITGFGTITDLIAGNTSTAIGFTTTVANAGTFTGNGALALQSDGTGIDSSGVSPLPSDPLSFTGTGFRYAAPSTVGPVNFGVVHVGDSVSEALSLTNTDPADGFSEALDAYLTATGAVTTSGSISLLAAGATDSNSLLLGLFTGASGIISGNATLGLISDGSTIDFLGTTVLGSQLIGVTATIDNYATAAFTDPGGPVITAGTAANSFVLNLGTAMAGSAALSVTLGALNSATGLADLLGGTISTAGGAGFTDTGFGMFSGLGAGMSELGQSITLSTATAGMFTETVTLSASGSNSSGYIGATQTEILTIIGDIIPAATTYDLTNAGTTIVGAPGVDIFVATNGVLNSKDSLTGSNSGQNVLQFSGGGTFDVSAPSVFTNIQTIQAVEGQAGAGKVPATYQTVYLRNGTSELVTVANGTPAMGNNKHETIIIHGANNNDVIDLATGFDTVYLGGNGETVNGGGGADTIYATTGSIGAKVNGGTGSSTLDLLGGGTFTLGANITNIASLTLSAASVAYNVTANSMTGLVITGSGAADTITLGDKSQSVNANGGAVHVLATARQGSAQITGAAGAVFEITTPGTITLNKMDSNLTVQLDKAGTLTLNKATFINAIVEASGSTLTAADTSQTLSSAAGGDSLIGYAKFGDTFSGSSAGLNTDTITNFGGNDVIDVNDLIFGSLKDSYSGNATQGTLTLSDGTHNLAITMVGSYTLSSFHFGTDGHSGTDITFV
jgi:hypothetical protein